MYFIMNFLLLLLTVCIAMAVYGRDLIRTSPNYRQRISPAQITIESESKYTSNNGFYSGDNNVATYVPNTVNKMWIRNIFSARKIKGSDKINQNGLIIGKYNSTTTKAIPKQNIEMVLIQPKLRQCLEGMVRDTKGECTNGFEN
ncbi:uncharacterized protein LOC113548868 [Rhopalosiphum maidis]|uniref:uncharacterized protein LOC113548868 n=1 Tax=Rhopalosiphum maidis TaxID=43146 RepID=UPI000EFDF197|nr:uncharacterized protein LOC113548868 [Rhopalosiphum maidis]